MMGGTGRAAFNTSTGVAIAQTLREAQGRIAHAASINSPLPEQEAVEVAAEAIRETREGSPETQAREVIKRLKWARVVKDFPQEGSS